MVTRALWPPAPPAPRQIFAPLHAITTQVPAPRKRPVPQGHASARRPSRPGSRGSSKGDGRAQRPGRNQIEPKERSGRVREVFHRKRGGEPTASSTGRRACTGGQRQSYKRAGYLTRSSALVSRGPVGTATEPRSSSWKDRRCFLEGRGRAVVAEAPHWAGTHRPPQAFGARRRALTPRCGAREPSEQRGPGGPGQAHLRPLPHPPHASCVSATHYPAPPPACSPGTWVASEFWLCPPAQLGGHI